MYNKDKIFQMTGLNESEFYKKYPTKAHFEKEHGADIFAQGGLMQNSPQLQDVTKQLLPGLAGIVGGVAGGAIGTAIAPGVGTTIGGGLGSLLGGIGGKQIGNIFDHGGPLTEVNTGGTHQENPNGGVPVIGDKLVEEGETIFDGDKGKYVFSDRIMKDKKSFADLSKLIDRKYAKREGDKLAETARKRELSALMLEQEVARIGKAGGQQMAMGGLASLGTSSNLTSAVNVKTDFLNNYINKTPGGLPMATTLDKYDLNSAALKPNTTFNQNDNLGVLPGSDLNINNKVFNPTTSVIGDSNSTNIPNLKENNTSNFKKLKDIDLSMLEYLPQAAGSLFNIAKGIGSNKQINYKGITPKLVSSNYNLTSSLTNLNSDSAGVNADIRNNSNLSLAQKISALGSVSANTQKARAGMINEGNYNNMMGNTNLINTAKQYNAGVFDRNIDANEMYQDKRAEAVKAGLDNLGTGSSTYIKDKRAAKYENVNNKMLADLFKELYPEATKRAKFGLKSYGEKED